MMFMHVVIACVLTATVMDRLPLQMSANAQMMGGGMMGGGGGGGGMMGGGDTTSPGTLCATDGSSSEFIISDPSDGFVTITSNGCPSHAHTNAVGNNPNSATEQSYTFVIPVTPVFRSGAPNERLQTALDSVGVALSGVPIFGPAINQFGGDAGEAEIDTFDDGCGHSTQSGAYHNHIIPWTLETTYPKSAAGHSALLGWMPDGFPIYGLYQTTDTRPDDLDDYGGHSDATRGYHYHFTGPEGPCPRDSNPDGGFPYIAKALRGCVPDNAENGDNFAQPESYDACVAASTPAPSGIYITGPTSTTAPTMSAPITVAPSPVPSPVSSKRPSRAPATPMPSSSAAPTPAINMPTPSPTSPPTSAAPTVAEQQESVCKHDSSGDGTVGVGDLADLLIEWGKDCN